MPSPKKGRRFGGSPAHQRLILANMATALFEHGRVRTTEAKARVLRPFAEKLITKATKGDLHNRRQVMRTIRDKEVVHILFTEIAPRYAERPGGYTRITKLSPRKGDNAPMAMIELVTEDYEPRQRATSSAQQGAPTSGGTGAGQSAQQDSSASDEVGGDGEAADETTGPDEAATSDDASEQGAEDGTGEDSDDEVTEQDPATRED